VSSLKNAMRISEVAQKYGISRRTLRYYEEIGILASLRDETSNYRYYDTTALKRLEQILLLRNLDFPINKITEILLSENNSISNEIFLEKFKTLQDEIEVLLSLRNIIASIIKINAAAGTDNVNVYEILKEQIYINKKVEGVLSMNQYTGDSIVIEFGLNIVPCADELITGIKELRKQLEMEAQKGFPLIRIRDVDTLTENQYQISIKGVITTNEDLENISNEDKASKMLSNLKDNIMRNIDNLIE
jgi:DNA-binding transcriptional MerR regulator